MATNTLMHTDFEFIGQTNKYTGKVREVYTLEMILDYGCDRSLVGF